MRSPEGRGARQRVWYRHLWRAWQGEVGEADARESFGWRALRFCGAVLRDFNRNRGFVRAAALSYATLLSLVPLLALVLGVSSTVLKGRTEAQIEAFVDRLVQVVVPPAAPTNLPPALQAEFWIHEMHAQWWAPGLTLALPTRPPGSDSDPQKTNGPVPTGTGPAAAAEKPTVQASVVPQQDLRRVVAARLREFIQHTRSAELGVSGSIGLLLMAILLLARVENTMNDIWGVPEGRPWFMRVVLYWACLTLAPLLIVGAVALASGPYWETPREWLLRTPAVGDLVFRALPLLMLWVLFMGVYRLVPNTHVEWSAALVGGAFAASLWHLNNLLNVLYVSRVVTNFKIYGSLGLVPVFMVGLYVAWVIVLLGAQVTYTWQHRAHVLQGSLVGALDQRGRELLALRVLALVGRAFQQAEPPPSVDDLARASGAVPRICSEVLDQLKRAGLILELAGTEPAYVPARPLETITLHDVLRALRSGNGSEWTSIRPDPTHEVWSEYERVLAAEEQVASAVTLRELVARMGSRPVLVPGATRQLQDGAAVHPPSQTGPPAAERAASVSVDPADAGPEPTHDAREVQPAASEKPNPRPAAPSEPDFPL